MIPEHIRNTSDDKLAAVVRLLLAIVFVMTGVMKLVVPTLGEAWSGQLLAANVPFYTLTRWTVPFVEHARPRPGRGRGASPTPHRARRSSETRAPWRRYAPFGRIDFLLTHHAIG